MAISSRPRGGDPDLLGIGALAERTGYRASALRFYEDIGLLEPALRASGRRRYTPDAVHHVGLIALCQDAGFSLDEIRRLMPHDRGSRRRWEDLAQGKLRQLDDAIRTARAARRLLRETIACRCTQLGGCELVRAAGERRRSHRRRRMLP